MTLVAVSRTSEQCSLLFIGTATILLRLGAFTLLIDPNFLHCGRHAYLGYTLVRVAAPSRRSASMTCPTAAR